MLMLLHFSLTKNIKYIYKGKNAYLLPNTYLTSGSSQPSKDNRSVVNTTNMYIMWTAFTAMDTINF